MLIPKGEYARGVPPPGLEPLSEWAQRFSPVVRSVPPNVLLLDVTGCARLFHGEENIVRQLLAGLATQQIRARAAIADTVGAAWALAHAAESAALVVPPGQAPPYLVGLPPAAMRLDEKTVAVLDHLGIRSIGDLLMLPRASLPARFGEPLVLRLRQMLGDTPEPISPPRPAPVFTAPMGFGPTDQLDVVLAALERVVAALCAQLVTGGVAARTVEGVVYFAEGAPAATRIGLSRPSREARHLRTLLILHLEHIDLTPGVSGLRVTAIETAAWHATQGDLFAESEQPDAEAVGALLDRLTNHLGRDAVVRAELVDDHQPEKAFRYVSWIGAGEAGRARLPPTWVGLPSQGGEAPFQPRESEASAESSPLSRCPMGKQDAHWSSTSYRTYPRGPESPSANPQSPIRNPQSPDLDRTRDLAEPPPGERPLYLFLRPQSARVLALVPEGPPTWFHYHGQDYTVAHAAGPERLETGWWRGADLQRDYFRVATTTGQQFWLFRDLHTQQWSVHGTYA
jgi:protein ImuB